MNQDPLSKLRDIHLPPEPSFWPPAIGWWFLFILLLALTALTVFLIIRWKKGDKRRTAIKKLENIRNQFNRTKNYRNLSSQISILLRKCSLSLSQPIKNHSLHGEEWLAFLDSHSSNNIFSSELKEPLLICPYTNREILFDAEKLMSETKNWIRRNL